jgi:4-hydroxy-4-methyl-2-oxoglutarate aldolase
VQIASVQEPVTAGDTLVHPGDIVIADDSGVLVVPRVRQDDVLLKACDIAVREENIVEMLNSGLSLKEARNREGYHQIGKQQCGNFLTRAARSSVTRRLTRELFNNGSS